MNLHRGQPVATMVQSTSHTLRQLTSSDDRKRLAALATVVSESASHANAVPLFAPLLLRGILAGPPFSKEAKPALLLGRKLAYLALRGHPAHGADWAALCAAIDRDVQAANTADNTRVETLELGVAALRTVLTLPHVRIDEFVRSRWEAIVVAATVAASTALRVAAIDAIVAFLRPPGGAERQERESVLRRQIAARPKFADILRSLLLDRDDDVCSKGFELLACLQLAPDDAAGGAGGGAGASGGTAAALLHVGPMPPWAAALVGVTPEFAAELVARAAALPGTHQYPVALGALAACCLSAVPASAASGGTASMGTLLALADGVVLPGLRAACELESVLCAGGLLLSLASHHRALLLSLRPHMAQCLERVAEAVLREGAAVLAPPAWGAVAAPAAFEAVTRGLLLATTSPGDGAAARLSVLLLDVAASPDASGVTSAGSAFVESPAPCAVARLLSLVVGDDVAARADAVVAGGGAAAAFVKSLHADAVGAAAAVGVTPLGALSSWGDDLALGDGGSCGVDGDAEAPLPAAWLLRWCGRALATTAATGEDTAVFGVAAAAARGGGVAAAAGERSEDRQRRAQRTARRAVALRVAAAVMARLCDDASAAAAVLGPLCEAGQRQSGYEKFRNSSGSSGTRVVSAATAADRWDASARLSLCARLVLSLCRLVWRAPLPSAATAVTGAAGGGDAAFAAAEAALLHSAREAAAVSVQALSAVLSAVPALEGPAFGGLSPTFADTAATGDRETRAIASDTRGRLRVTSYALLVAAVSAAAPSPSTRSAVAVAADVTPAGTAAAAARWRSVVRLLEAVSRDAWVAATPVPGDVARAAIVAFRALRPCDAAAGSAFAQPWTTVAGSASFDFAAEAAVAMRRLYAAALRVAEGRGDTHLNDAVVQFVHGEALPEEGSRVAGRTAGQPGRRSLRGSAAASTAAHFLTLLEAAAFESDPDALGLPSMPRLPPPSPTGDAPGSPGTSPLLMLGSAGVPAVRLAPPWRPPLVGAAALPRHATWGATSGAALRRVHSAVVSTMSDPVHVVLTASVAFGTDGPALIEVCATVTNDTPLRLSHVAVDFLSSASASPTGSGLSLAVSHAPTRPLHTFTAPSGGIGADMGAAGVGGGVGAGGASGSVAYRGRGTYSVEGLAPGASVALPVAYDACVSGPGLGLGSGGASVVFASNAPVALAVACRVVVTIVDDGTGGASGGDGGDEGRDDDLFAAARENASDGGDGGGAGGTTDDGDGNEGSGDNDNDGGNDGGSARRQEATSYIHFPTAPFASLWLPLGFLLQHPGAHAPLLHRAVLLATAESGVGSLTVDISPMAAAAPGRPADSTAAARSWCLLDDGVLREFAVGSDGDYIVACCSLPLFTVARCDFPGGPFLSVHWPRRGYRLAVEAERKEKRRAHERRLRVAQRDAAREAAGLPRASEAAPSLAASGGDAREGERSASDDDDEDADATTQQQQQPQPTTAADNVLLVRCSHSALLQALATHPQFVPVLGALWQRFSDV